MPVSLSEGRLQNLAWVCELCWGTQNWPLSCLGGTFTHLSSELCCSALGSSSRVASLYLALHSATSDRWLHFLKGFWKTGLKRDTNGSSNKSVYASELCKWILLWISSFSIVSMTWVPNLQRCQHLCIAFRKLDRFVFDSLPAQYVPLFLLSVRACLNKYARRELWILLLHFFRLSAPCYLSQSMLSLTWFIRNRLRDLYNHSLYNTAAYMWHDMKK